MQQPINNNSKEKENRKKNIGYLAPQYYDAQSYIECPNIMAINEVLKEFTIKAQNMAEPDWYVKGACLYFTYDEVYYVIGPTCIDTTAEIFDRLSFQLEDALYDAGAYDMFYAGMID